MTIASETRRAGPFSGNGVTTAFPFAFKVFTTANVQVVKTDAFGTETTLLLTSNYTIALNADQSANPGGTITYPASGTPLAVGEKLTVVGSLQAVQGTDLTNAGGFYPEVVEDAFDYLTILIQQLKELITRVVTNSLSVTTSGVSGVLPAPVANLLLGWNATQTALENKAIATGAVVTPFVATLLDDTSAPALRNTLGVNSAAPFVQTNIANALTLIQPAGYANEPVNGFTYGFVATMYSTGNVTIRCDNGNVYPCYRQDGQRCSGLDIQTGRYYQALFLQSLNAGAGGFIVFSSGNSDHEMMGIDASIRVASDATAKGLQIAYVKPGNGLYLWNPVALRYEYRSVPGSTGVLAFVTNNNTLLVNSVANQSLVAGTKYNIFARVATDGLTLHFSTDVVSLGDPFGVLPNYGWGSRNGDPQDRWVGMIQTNAAGNVLEGGGAPPSGATQHNVCSYYNPQHITIQCVPSGSTASVTWDNASISGGLLACCRGNEDGEPIGGFSGSVANSVAGATTYIGISLNGAAPIVYQRIDQGGAGAAMAFSLTWPGGTPNYAIGRTTFQVQMKVSAGTATLIGPCVFALAVEL
jgi:hypothetical protein